MDIYADTDFFMDLTLVDDPYPYFEYLRGLGSVVPLPAHKVVAVVGFEEALAVHLDTATLSAVNSVTGPIPPIPFTPEGDDIAAQIEAHRPQMPFGEDVLTLDRPRHTPLRALMMPLFTPRRLKEMETSIARLADVLIDEFIGDGGCEFVGAYATPFAMLAIAELLGVPEEERVDFRTNLDGAPAQIGTGEDYVVTNPIDFRRERFFHYIEEHRRNASHGILGELASATFPDGSLPAIGDVVSVAALLFAAGQDTTGTLLGSCLRILAESSELQSQLRADPGLIPAFIEEVLRISGPVKSTFRLARKPTRVGDVEVAPGETIMITTAAANRDPRKFDNPSRFKLGRPDIKEHLSFGRGIHTCPGAALARTETRISMERLLARTGWIAIDDNEHGSKGDRRFSYAPTYVFRALANLHLTFSAS